MPPEDTPGLLVFSRSIACNFIKKETLTQMFTCELCDILKLDLSLEHLRWLLLGSWEFFEFFQIVFFFRISTEVFSQPRFSEPVNKVNNRPHIVTKKVNSILKAKTLNMILQNIAKILNYIVFVPVILLGVSKIISERQQILFRRFLRGNKFI